MNAKTVAAVTATVAAALVVGFFVGRLGMQSSPKDSAVSAAAPAAAGDGKPGERKLLYYRNPMGLADTSPVPKKDPMGMDYIPVYEGEEPDTTGNQIKISADKVQKLGVRSEPAALRSLAKIVRASGRIEVDERRVY